ncbi:MAG: hypothetical protein ABIQ39_13050 [Ilumatobacteraceae bacterium]
MFTTGSKLFLAGTAVSALAAVVWGITNGGPAGWLGTVGLISLAVAFALLFGITTFVRDCNVPGSAPGAATQSAAAQRPAGRSMWPAIAAVGIGLMTVGADTRPLVFKVGVVVLLAAIVEWMVQGWSERASSDPAYNATVRQRVAHPLELPLIGAAGLAVMIYSFSRIMLFLSKSNGPWAFIMVGVVILVFAFTFASRPSLRKGVIVGVCTIGALGLVSTGAVMAIGGQREIPKHPTVADDAYAQCTRDAATTEANPEYAEIEHRASQHVAAKSDPMAQVELRNGQLEVYIVGIAAPQKTLTVARGNIVNILFVNRDPGKVRLTAYAGTDVQTVNDTVIKRPRRTCTTLIGTDNEQMLNVVFPKASEATTADDPYTLTVPGLAGQQIKVVVP